MKLLIVGNKGQVGTNLMNLSEDFGFTAVGYDLPEIDITDPDSVSKIFNDEKPDLVINAAAFTAVDKAEEEVDLAYNVNDLGVKILSENCEQLGIPFFHISTDYVFDGEEGMYLENSEVNPQSVYGASKLAGEISAKNHCSKAVVLRTSWIFSEFGNNFLKTMVRLARTRDSLGIVDDQKGSPTSARHVAEALLKLALEYRTHTLKFGTYHFSGVPYSTWHGFADFILSEAAKVKLIDKKPVVNPIKTEDYPLPAARPADSRLDCSKIHNEISNLNNDWRVEVARVVNVLKEEGF